VTEIPEADLTLDWIRPVDLPEALDNVKDHDEDAIRASIIRWGFNEPLTIDERTGRLVAGHGRRKVIIELEREWPADEAPPSRVKLDDYAQWLLPVLRGVSFPDDLEAEAYALAANRLGERGGWKVEPLAERLRVLTRADVGRVRVAGFDEKDVRTILSKTNVVAPPTVGRERKVEAELTCPRCKHHGPAAGFTPAE
jgi:hypothetical protein